MDSKELDAFYSQVKEELNTDDELGMPNENHILIDIHELLDNTDPKHIYLTSDWHLFKNHYKKEANYVNTKEILTWCKQNIKPDDVFMYLGDISFRYANEEDQKESQRLLASIPGHKILILGNHDMMLGQEYFTGCGFHYVYDRLDHNNILYTHKPENIDIMPEEYLNIHGHIHKWTEYNTCDGKRNVNVYPYFFGNKPVTLDYLLKHKEELMKNNKRSDWTQIGESAEYRDIEDLDVNLETSRANLKNSEFGIPEDRKYPLDSKKHVMSAIKLFGHAEESKKKALAKRIKSAADKYNINIPETTQVNKYLSESNINEWSMAAMNPVIGITKPYVLKMCNDSGNLLDAKRYALVTDLVSDKYLVINEDANLEIVDASYIENMLVEEYEFIGDQRLLKKIEEAYYSKKTVDNTFFYTALTGKPMLSEDQIDFDSNFKKVDFIKIKENSLTKLATLYDGFMNTINNNHITLEVAPNNHVKSLIKDRPYLVLKEDLNGFYILNIEKNIRSHSVEEQNFITEQIVYSVL
jgi:calcineurin-like phosphoesterase family protein